MATFTVAIGNADAHGKNLSLLLPPGGRIELAVFIDDHRQIDAVDIAALRAEATRWHLADDVDDRILGFLGRFEGALEVAANAVLQAPWAPDRPPPGRGAAPA